MISGAIPNSYSVNLRKNKFYDYSYDFTYSLKRNTRISNLVFALVSPIILAKCAVKYSGFIYIGSDGFLESEIDSRDFEFRFLRRKNKLIVCYFLGNDIRSNVKMQQRWLISGEENYSNYLPWVDKIFNSSSYDDVKFNIAQVALKYSRVIFSTQYDQDSYLEERHYPVRYLFDFKDRIFDSKKFSNLKKERIVVFHASSSPIVKGTQVIRTVIKMLKLDGFDFDYVEMMEVSNREVLEQLSKSHIVINELYAFMPGVFAIESMANSCAVLTRADPYFEKSLPIGSEKAWIVTPSYLLYRNLRSLLENPESIETQALNGFIWARNNASLQSEGPKLQKILEDILPSQ